METDTDTTPEKALAQACDGWKIQCDPIPGRSGGAKWDAQAVHFRVTVTAPTGEWSGEYSAGGAHPIMAAKRAAESAEAWRAYCGRGHVRLLRDHVQRLPTFPTYKARTIHDAELEERLRKMYRPTLVDVVGSLFCDASGLDDGLTSFREWCDDLGWEGHPADARDTYEACLVSARFLRRAFGARFEEVAEAAREL